jgi:hypothetical protein
VLELRLQEIEEAARQVCIEVDRFEVLAESISDQWSSQELLDIVQFEELIYRSSVIQRAYLIIKKQLQSEAGRFINTKRVSGIQQRLYDCIAELETWIPFIEKMSPVAVKYGLTTEMQQHQIDSGIAVALKSFPSHWKAG